MMTTWTRIVVACVVISGQIQIHFEDRTVKDLLMRWIEYIMMNRIWGVEEGGIKNDA